MEYYLTGKMKNVRKYNIVWFYGPEKKTRILNANYQPWGPNTEKESEAFWGMGFARAVGKQFVEFGFKEFNLNRIYTTCDPRNIGSSKVLEKVGMTNEGRMREDLLIKGH